MKLFIVVSEPLKAMACKLKAFNVHSYWDLKRSGVEKVREYLMQLKYSRQDAERFVEHVSELAVEKDVPVARGAGEHAYMRLTEKECVLNEVVSCGAVSSVHGELGAGKSQFL